MSELEILTFGCRLNTFESALMKDMGQKAKLTDTIIINTCAVTAEAERQARQAIRKAHRDNPHKKIVVTGCAAQIRPHVFSQIKGVTHVLGNQEKMQLSSYENLGEAKSFENANVAVTDIMAANETDRPPVATSFDNQARAYVEIQNGCNHRCTFCTIPFGRGNNRSTPVAQIVGQVRLLCDQGYNEVVFTGVDITDYGQDLPGKPSLGDLIKRVFSNVPQLKRLRLSSLDPVEMDPVLYDLIAGEPRLMPYFHLSVQAGDTMILKRMKRRHVREDVITCVEKIRRARPDAILGADVIAGFPTESAQMFENTYDLLKALDFTFLHVFPYSPRPGTPAARMPQVEKAIIKSRAARLRALGDDRRAAYLKTCVGQTPLALMESALKARTDTYAPVELRRNGPTGAIVQLKNIHFEGGVLTGDYSEIVPTRP